MTPLQDLCYHALKRLGAQGFVDTDAECGCNLEDFAPCGDGPYSECQPAIKLIIPDDPDDDLIDPQTGQRVSRRISEGNWLRVDHDGKPGDWVMVPFRQ